MKRQFKLKNAFSFCCIIMLFGACTLQVSEQDYTQYVNPFIGTQHEGHCFPGATMPMGMVQASPESTTDYSKNYPMSHVTGYQYNDPYIAGFTQTHLNGVGCPSMSDILLMPYCKRRIEASQRKNYRSSYDKRTEKATPGYYGVVLTDNHVAVEMTATHHAAYYKMHYEERQTARLLVDLQYGVGWDEDPITNNVLEATVAYGDYSISGYRKARQWAERPLYFVIRFNKKIRNRKELIPPKGSLEKAPRVLVEFDMGETSELEVTVGLSMTSVEQAIQNLDDEITPDATFKQIQGRAKEVWNHYLSKINITADDDQKTVFYTAIYHMYMQPNNLADRKGTFRTASNEVKKSRSGRFYSTLSLWDTYRATHPLYTLLTPSLVPMLNSSIMEHYAALDSTQNRFLPRWALWGKETNTMIGNHAIPVLVDAWLKGLKPLNYSDEELWEAIWTTISKPHYRNHVALVDQYGYIPYDKQDSAIDDGNETVSRLLENIYDNYCAALLAEQLGKTKEAKYLRHTATYYTNVYDSVSGFMRGRNAKGDFKKNVDVDEVVGEWVDFSDFTEGNAWHYLFHVQHDIVGLRKLMGGEPVFREKLDSIFYTTHRKPYVKGSDWKLYGTLGSYWHGNEPCHHLPYLYKYTTQGYKTDAIINYLVKQKNNNAPDGLLGNDDCGQMSAWYIFSTLGFYPVNPCGGEFILGAPQAEKSILHLENGHVLTIEAENISKENIFVESVSFNGTQITNNRIQYKDLMQGGMLKFRMKKRSDRTKLQTFKE